MLEPSVVNYILFLTQKLPEIKSIWLIGSRANGRATNKSDWDFLVFGDYFVLESIKADSTFHRDDVDLLIVLDNEFHKPYGTAKGGSLKEWEWEVESETLATYMGLKWIESLDDDIEMGLKSGVLINKKHKAIRVF